MTTKHVAADAFDAWYERQEGKGGIGGRDLMRRAYLAGFDDGFKEGYDSGEESGNEQGYERALDDHDL